MRTQVDKHEIIRELNLASRDLITVDQDVPIAYPSGLLVRERAIIVNLDSIRLIAGKDQARRSCVPRALDDAARLDWMLCRPGHGCPAGFECPERCRCT